MSAKWQSFYLGLSMLIQIIENKGLDWIINIMFDNDKVTPEWASPGVIVTLHQPVYLIEAPGDLGPYLLTWLNLSLSMVK